MNTIKLPIKSIDIDAFIKIYKNEANELFNNLDKKKDPIKYFKELYNQTRKSYKIMKKSQKRELKILDSIIKERDIKNFLINRENRSFIKYLQKKGYKISFKDDYKIKKRNIVKKLYKHDYHNFTHNLVTKNGKKYFEKVGKPPDFILLGHKKILRLSKTSLLSMLEGYKKHSKFKFIPKFIEAIIVCKNGVVKNIKYIFEYIDGTPLVTYIKQLNDKKKEQLKNKIKKYMNELKKKKEKYTSYQVHKDIIITKKGDAYLTGMQYYNDLPSQLSQDDLINTAFQWNPENSDWRMNNIIIDIQHIILFELLRKDHIKFR
jgi:hypothetical protein